MSPALADGFLTSVPPGKSLLALLKYFIWKLIWLIVERGKEGKREGEYLFVWFFQRRVNFPLFIEKADKLSLEILHHLQHYSSIGMVNLWIYIILERQMCEFTILFSNFFFLMAGEENQKVKQ